MAAYQWSDPDKEAFVMATLNNLSGILRSLQKLEPHGQSFALAWTEVKTILQGIPNGDTVTLAKASDHAGAQPLTPNQAVANGDAAVAAITAVQASLSDRATLQKQIGPGFVE